MKRIRIIVFRIAKKPGMQVLGINDLPPATGRENR